VAILGGWIESLALSLCGDLGREKDRGNRDALKCAQSMDSI